MTAGYGSTERMTPLIALRLCEELCEALDGYRMLNGWDIHRAMSGRCVVFVPWVDPDDTYYSTAWERENQPLFTLCRRVAFRHVIALREQGEEITWRCKIRTPAESELIARVLGVASGLPVSYAVTDGELKDWFMKEFHQPGFTLRLGRISPETFESKYQKIQEMLLISALL